MQTNGPDLTLANWRKSSYSNAEGGDCLEVATDFPDIVPVRDSKSPCAPALVFEAPAWSAFIDRVKSSADVSAP